LKAFSLSLSMAQRVCGSRPNVPAICASEALWIQEWNGEET
jgi:hypothetical protein